MSWFIGLIRRLIKSSFQLFLVSLWVLQLHLVDFWYTFLALVLPQKKVGQVIPPGRPGYRGIWPTYMPPGPDDSRSPCPGLNACANHGILPRNGRRITYKQMADALQYTYNLAPTLAKQLTASAYLLDQGRGYIDLFDLNALNVVQHDASFTRPDIRYCPDQSMPHSDLVNNFLSYASKPNKISVSDISYFSGVRRRECQEGNTQYSMFHSFLHKFFGSGNAALMYSLFDGNVEDLRIWLAEERIPDGWEPKVRWPKGHPITFAQKTTFEIEFNIDEDTPLALRPTRSRVRGKTVNRY